MAELKRNKGTLLSNVMINSPKLVCIAKCFLFNLFIEFRAEILFRSFFGRLEDTKLSFSKPLKMKKLRKSSNLMLWQPTLIIEAKARIKKRRMDREAFSSLFLPR